MAAYPVVFSNAVIQVQDIAAALPRHRHWPYNYRRTDRYRLLPHRPIDRVYWHHTAGHVPQGIAGPMATANYCVADPNPDASAQGGRGWPGMPYHLFIPYAPERTAEGQRIVYQCQPLDLWTWHTSGKARSGRSRNKFGLGVVCQGRFFSRHEKDNRILPGQTGQPSADQVVASTALWFAFLKPLYALANTQLSGHFEAGKPSCPGDFFELWVRSIQSLPERASFLASAPPCHCNGHAGSLMGEATCSRCGAEPKGATAAETTSQEASGG